MKVDYSFSFFECQTCVSKVNCEKCGSDVYNGLMSSGLVSYAAVDMNNKIITVDFDREKEDDVIDFLEGAGVFV